MRSQDDAASKESRYLEIGYYQWVSGQALVPPNSAAAACDFRWRECKDNGIMRTGRGEKLRPPAQIGPIIFPGSRAHFPENQGSANSRLQFAID
jgi:hypothetical protein